MPQTADRGGSIVHLGVTVGEAGSTKLQRGVSGPQRTLTYKMVEFGGSSNRKARGWGDKSCVQDKGSRGGDGERLEMHCLTRRT